MFFCELWSTHSHKTECRRRPKETQAITRHSRATSAAGAQGRRSHQNKQHFWLLFCLFFDPETTLLLVSVFFSWLIMLVSYIISSFDFVLFSNVC